MVNGNDAMKGGLVTFAITSVTCLVTSVVLEITSPDFFCAVTGDNGKNCGYTMALFFIAITFLVMFCIGSLLWTTFTRYTKPFTEE